MRDRKAFPGSAGVLVVAILVALVLLTLELPAQGPSASVSAAMTNALAERDNLPAAEGSLWRFEGPRNLRHGLITGYGLGPHSGRINEVAVYPGDPQIIYAAAATGGVWKTMDGGAQWTSRSDGWPIQSATAVAVDPTNPNRVFAGTGDYRRLDHVPPFSVGVMRSLDGGLTWEQFGSPEMRDYTVSRIVIDPGNPQNVIAATGRGSRLPGGTILRSIDGGTTWSASAGPPDGNWDDLRFCGHDVLWAAATRRKSLDVLDVAGNDTGLLYKSHDRGATWTQVTVTTELFELGSTTGSNFPDTIHLACNPGSDFVFLAVYQGSTARVFSTSDFGGSWSERTKDAVPVGGHPWAHSAFGVTTTKLFIGAVELFRAPLDASGQLVHDGPFLRFPCLPTHDNPDPCTDDIPGPTLHSDFQCAVPHPTDTDVVFLCNDEGLYRHRVQDNTTVPLSATLGVTQVYRMDVHPRHGGLIAIGMQDLGDAVSFFGNGNDAAALRAPANWGLVLGGDGRSAAFRQDGSSRVYFANTAGIVARYDGATRTVLRPSTAPNQAPLLHRNNTLYYGDTAFWQLLDPETKDNDQGTADWTPKPFRSDGTLPATIQSLAVCPTNPQVMYAGSLTGEIFYSDTGGQTWRDDLDVSGVPALPIWAISPSPSNCRDVLIGVGYEGHVVRTGSNTFYAGDRLLHKTDVLAAGGWTGAHGGPNPLPHAPLYGVVRHPAAPGLVWFVAGDAGVFRTANGGASWTNATAPLGLPNTLVRDLRLSADGNTLYAGTFGRGVWSMDVSRPANDVFGVRGRVTVDGRPSAGTNVVAEGAGRIRKWLSNTITTGFLATTADITVAESAPIATVTAIVKGTHLGLAKFNTPSGQLSMNPVSTSGGVTTYELPSSSGSSLVGQTTRGSWSFRVGGTAEMINGTIVQFDPSVVSASVEFQFNDGISDITGPDGEYTLEFLRAGSHLVSIPGCATCRSHTVDLDSHDTTVDFELNAVSIATTIPNASESGSIGRFTVSRAGSTTNQLTVHYSVGGTAANGVDYVGLNGSVTIPAGSPSALIAVIPLNDALNENTEQVNVTLDEGAGYSVGQASAATVQILDNDPLPGLSVNNVSVTEGAIATFTVTLSPVSGRTVTVNYATANDTAIAGSCPAADYVARTGTLSFPPGTTSQGIKVQTCTDLAAEGVETFLLRLTGPVNAVISAGTGTAAIR